MNDVWVVNASPLIVLGKIGQLDLLQQLSQEIVVPSAVKGGNRKKECSH